MKDIDGYHALVGEPLVMYSMANAFYGYWFILSFVVLPFELFVGVGGDERYVGL